MANFNLTYPSLNVPTYSSFSAFPSANSLNNGQLVLALDSDILYVSNGTTWVMSNYGYTTTVTANQTTTLTAISTQRQYFTGSTANQIIKLPVTSTLVVGMAYEIHNDSTQTVTINSSGSNLVKAVAAGTVCIVTCIATTHTTAVDWSVEYIPETIGTVTSVDVSGGTTGLTTSGGPITTTGTITLAGTLVVANGGTNSTTALNNNRVMQSSSGAIVEAAAITASRALVSDANGIPVAATTTTTEINYVNGVTSAIQTQLNAKQSTTLTSAHLLVGSAGNIATDVAASGDVTLANTGAFTVATVGGSSAANIHSAELAANAATATVTASTIAKWDASSNLSANVLISTVAIGTAPLTVTSTTRVTNLNAATAGNADTVTTNANLTGVITSVGNATSIASQTGTGTKFVVDTSPTLVTPNIGVATANSINKMAITAPATSSTLAIADGKSLTVSNILTFTGTDSSSVAFGTGGTVLYSGGALGTPSSGTLSNCTTVKGITSGSAPAAGIIGEVLGGTSLGGAITVTTSLTELGNLPLTAGSWEVTATVSMDGSASTTAIVDCYLATASASSSGTTLGITKMRMLTNLIGVGTCSMTIAVETNTTPTYYLNAVLNSGTQGAGAILGQIIAVRKG